MIGTSRRALRGAGRVALNAEFDAIDAIDWFLLQHRLPDGRTVLARFVAARGDLPRGERDLLLAWHDVVEGMFEVERRNPADPSIGAFPGSGAQGMVGDLTGHHAPPPGGRDSDGQPAVDVGVDCTWTKKGVCKGRCRIGQTERSLAAGSSTLSARRRKDRL